jgi:hypothetical protein
VQFNIENTLNLNIDNLTYIILGLVYTYTFYGKQVVFVCSNQNYQFYISDYFANIISKLTIKYRHVQTIMLLNGGNFVTISFQHEIGTIRNIQKTDLLIIESDVMFDIPYKCILRIGDKNQLKFDWFYDEFLKRIKIDFYLK